MKYRTYNIPTDRHVAVCGMTRSGKSVLCEEFLARYKYVVKLDTKHEAEERRRKNEPIWNHLQEGKDYVVCERLSELDSINIPKIVYMPPFEEQSEECYNRFFRWIYERENTILWIDELMVIGTANRYPMELQRLCVMGNSKNISCWFCTQRPSGIPNIVLANCSFVFCFNLNLPADRKKMVEMTGCEEMLTMPRDHNFYYYRVGDESCIKARLKL